jgi:hypothetical protein
MHVLLIGGSGHVGTLVTPFLKQHHTLRIYDLKPPAELALQQRLRKETLESISDDVRVHRAVDTVINSA